MQRHFPFRLTLLILLTVMLATVSSRLRADTGMCGGGSVTLPFTDVPASNGFFCAIAEAYFSGLTFGTSATTYTPTASVPREQMAAFVTRTLDQSLKRGHRRAALGEWWTNAAATNRYAQSTLGNSPQYLATDGHSLWISNTGSNTVVRIDIKTGLPICTLTGVPSPEQIVIVSGHLFIASFQSPGRIYSTTLSNTSDGPIIGLTDTLGHNPLGITYDGQNLWTANFGFPGGFFTFGSISRLPLVGSITDTFMTGFINPTGILFDGVNLWVTDRGDASLKRVDTSNGTILQTIGLSGFVGHPVFDGTNLWIPCLANPQLGVPDKVIVVRAIGSLVGTVLRELTGNGLNGSSRAAFDGERICVTNSLGNSVSLWKAADLSPIGSVNLSTPSWNSEGVCSDGTTFFVSMRAQGSNGGSVVWF
jgi:hypothetical protein